MTRLNGDRTCQIDDTTTPEKSPAESGSETTVGRADGRGATDSLKTILFWFRPDVGVFAVKFDVDDVRIAADRAVFDVLLVSTGGGIKRDHDLFAATVANVRGFAGEVVFGFISHGWMQGWRSTLRIAWRRRTATIPRTSLMAPF